MSGLLRVMIGAAVAIWGVAPAATAGGGALGPTVLLVTPWPAHDGCSIYAGVPFEFGTAT